MTAILLWPLVDIESPRLITSDMRVIDLLATNPSLWVSHLSLENQQRILEELYRWETAVLAGANAIEAHGYAVGGAGIDFRTWLQTDREVCSLDHQLV
jgi:hypothetical protein